MVVPSPLSADGFFVTASETLKCHTPRLGDSFLHHSGEIYGQEATSCLPVEVLRTMPLLSEGRPLRVLDLCAAPGSKASQVASQLRPELLVAPRHSALKPSDAVACQPLGASFLRSTSPEESAFAAQLRCEVEL